MKNQIHKGNPHANTDPKRMIEIYTFSSPEAQLFESALWQIVAGTPPQAFPILLPN